MLFKLPSDIRTAQESDIPQLRRLVNAAYQELADLGLNFTGTYQDDEITRERMKDAEVYLLHRGGELIASMNVSLQEADGQICLYINQLAVRPEYKRQGLGSYLLDLAEQRAEAAGIERLRLDTAILALHLLGIYRRRGFVEVEEVQWEGKTYRSIIMEKRLKKLDSGS
jgi:ribosomal protein S18 acetylase RimI-like enzyme